jgi:hypothetical protein
VAQETETRLSVQEVFPKLVGMDDRAIVLEMSDGRKRAPVQLEGESVERRDVEYVAVTELCSPLQPVPLVGVVGESLL